MELTALLAGEPKSDGPACTDPVLAAMARAVNDSVGDGSRQRLVALIPALIGAQGAGERVQRAVARRALLTALPFAGGRRRFVVAVALLGVDRADAGACEGWAAEMFDADTEWALLDAATVVGAAAEFVAPLGSAKGMHTRRGLPAAVELAVATIAESATDTDHVLYRLLEDSLRDYRSGGVAESGRRPAPAGRAG